MDTLLYKYGCTFIYDITMTSSYQIDSSINVGMSAYSQLMKIKGRELEETEPKNVNTLKFPNFNPFFPDI